MKLQTGRYGACAAAWNGRVYVFGGAGREGLITGVVEVINPRTENIAALPWKVSPRRYHGAATIDGFAYIAGGADGAGAVLERVDLRTGKVDNCRPMPTPRYAGAVVASAGFLWVVGGNAFGRFSGATEVYDPKRDTWEAAPAMPTPRECAATVYNGLIHVVGGYAGESGLFAHDTYAIGQGRWLPSRRLPFPMSAHRVGAVGGVLYTFGDYVDTGRVAACDLRTGRWQTPRLSEAFVPRRHSAVAVDGEAVAVIGGNVKSSGSYLDTVQVFRVTG